MDQTSNKFKLILGLFIAGGLTLFTAGIFIIGNQKNLFRPSFRLTTTFHNVGGLQVGNNVRFSGVNVGSIDNIKIINDSSVMVGMTIKKDIQKFIKMDCKAAIGSEGIIGDRVLIITQGTGDAPMISDGQSLSSIEPVETDAIISKLKVTADNSAIVTEEMAIMLKNINNGNGTLGRLIQDSVIAENISQAIINIKNSSKGLDENMDAVKNSFPLKGYYKRKEKRDKNRQDQELNKNSKK